MRVVEIDLGGGVAWPKAARTAEVRARFGDGDAALELYRRAGICP